MSAVSLTALSAADGGEGRRRRRLLVVWLPLIFSLLTMLIFSIDSLGTALQFDRDAIAAGEFWRVITCHWAHWSLDHALWDVGVFGLLAQLCVVRCPRRTFCTLVAGSVLIPAVVWFAQPGLQTYRGLSGLDSALMVLLCVRVMAGSTRGVARAAYATPLLLFVGKMAYEFAFATTIFVDASAAGFVPVPLAHLAGAGVGALFGTVGRPAKGWDHQAAAVSLMWPCEST